MDVFYSTYLLTHCFSEHWRKINSQKTEVEERSEEIPLCGAKSHEVGTEVSGLLSCSLAVLQPNLRLIES
jgi:hypothetical protein